MRATTDLGSIPGLTSSFSLFLFLGVSCATPREVLQSGPEPCDTPRLVIITADDFGASRNINEGIGLAGRAGVITAISAMTDFPESLAELGEIGGECPRVGIGVHLDITTGKPALPRSKSLRWSPGSEASTPSRISFLA